MRKLDWFVVEAALRISILSVWVEEEEEEEEGGERTGEMKKGTWRRVTGRTEKVVFAMTVPSMLKDTSVLVYSSPSFAPGVVPYTDMELPVGVNGGMERNGTGTGTRSARWFYIPVKS